MNISEVLDLDKYRVITLVGAGGKTSTLLAMAHEVQEKGIKTIITTTTKMAGDEVAGFKLILHNSLEKLSSGLAAGLHQAGAVVVGRGMSAEGKLLGIAPEWVSVLSDYSPDCIFLIEGDGAARKPFKAPGNNEPVVPDRTNLLIGLVGVDAIGLSLTEDNIHRAHRVSSLTGLPLGADLTVQAIAEVMMHRHGYKKNLPPHAEYLAVINKVDTFRELRQARELAAALLAAGCPKVIIAAMQQKFKVREVLTR
ncbi:selenium cofactor biosynthesis protein YqeC [Zhaonella formicivorans]|jgi:molybdenum cofactor cytidylyltransferase|uniref:selenium cofactor biosynthesis protein YqeC n=1 Tax=Zhaonella formicivorans TaxID=2528593 RepID=UPI001D1160FC|nr:selenium cofactor biosynthesis protein YqeC [Zhaonella formicivorans]